MAGLGLLAYIVSSKYRIILPLYRLENIFERCGFEISAWRAQSIWCGDAADCVTPLYELMAMRVRQSGTWWPPMTMIGVDVASVGKTKSARMWVKCRGPGYPITFSISPEPRPRRAEIFLAKITSKFCWPMAMAQADVQWPAIQSRAGCWAQPGGSLLMPMAAAPEIAREAVELIGDLFRSGEHCCWIFGRAAACLVASGIRLVLASRGRSFELKEQRRLRRSHGGRDPLRPESTGAELNVFCSDGSGTDRQQ